MHGVINSRPIRTINYNSITVKICYHTDIYLLPYCYKLYKAYAIKSIETPKDTSRTWSNDIQKLLV